VDDPEVRTARVVASSARARELGWDGEARRYCALVERLIREG
jgi:hypothetical protein